MDLQFYPTPPALARRVVDKFTRKPAYVLDPEAGTGALLEAVFERWKYTDSRYIDDNTQWKSDIHFRAIEIDPERCAVLGTKNFQVIGLDWETYSDPTPFDAIVMNPPFSKGAQHLLKAIAKGDNTEIACMLNHETLDNLCNVTRVSLHTKITALGGTVENLGVQEFTDDRGNKVAVNVDLVYVYVPARTVGTQDLQDIDTTERPIADLQVENLPACLDALANLEHYFNLTVQHRFLAFDHNAESNRFRACLKLKSQDASNRSLIPEDTSYKMQWLEQFRKDAWTAVINRTEFRTWLDKKQRAEFEEEITRGAFHAFTATNIRATLETILLKRQEYFEKSCANCFDSLTKFYAGNSEYHEGWKTNKAHKVGWKIIFPYGVSYDAKFDSFNLYSKYDREIDIYNDLDRVVCILTREPFADCNTIEKAVRSALLEYDARRWKRSPGKPIDAVKGIISDHFEIDLFKKGTAHVKFRDPKVCEDFNVMVAKGKKWLGAA
jgi:hypothetical protein